MSSRVSIGNAGQSTDLLFKVVHVLNARNIEYAVIGAMAVSVHGVVRASIDAGALISIAIGELQVLSDTLAVQGFGVELRRGDADDPIPGMLIVSDQHEDRVDLLVGLRGLDREVYQRAIEVRLPEYAYPLRVVGKEDVIAMKLFAGGPLDMMDAKRLIAVAGDTLDTALLQRLLVSFGHDAIANYKKLVT